MKAGRWGRTWVVAAVLVFMFLGSWEAFWRMRGFFPSLSDDRDVWAFYRRKASQKGEQAMVLAGSSRIQLGLHPDVFENITGVRPVNLYIDGSSPLPILEHLAQDERFKGNVICSLIPMFLAEPAADGRSQAWIQKYQEQKWSSRIETRLSMGIQEVLAFRNSNLAPSELWSHFHSGKWPQMPYAPMRPDRFRPADFSRADVESIRSGRVEREREIHARAHPLPRDRFIERVAHIDGMVKKIVARGGRVAFVRFPSGGTVRRLERQTWPRLSYWDVFARGIKAPAVHFEDYPALRGFDTPDGSHLDVQAAKRFTRSLIRILANKGFHPWET